MRFVGQGLSRSSGCWLGLVFAISLVCGASLSEETASRKIIRKIGIQGLVRESEGELLSRFKIRIGEVYEPDRVSEEAGNLYRLGKFRKIDLPQVTEFEDGVAITFVVEERPLVDSVTFQGRSALSESHLTTSPPSLQTKPGGFFNEAHANQDRESILGKYVEEGYVFAEVKVEITDAPRGKKVAFTIEEGSCVRIREVRFVGNKAVSSSVLLGIVETRERDFWFFGLLRSGIYKADVLEEDLARIELYYQRDGYFDAKAEVQELMFDAAKEKLTVVFRIHEGPRYTFRGYQLRGNAVFTDQTLTELTTARAGQPFNADAMEKDQQVITNYYRDRAYIFAQVKPNRIFSLEGQDVTVRIDIEEKNAIYIEEIRVRGNAHTLDEVIRRELEFYPDERVEWSRFSKSRSNLNRLQIFQNVDFAFEEGSSPSQRNVVVKVEEGSSGYVNLGFGLTSDLGIIGDFTFVQRNFDITDIPGSFSLSEFGDSFKGAGQTLRIMVRPGTKRSLYNFTFIEPYIFGTRNALQLTAYKRILNQNDYLEDHNAFAPRISHAFEFDRDFVFSLGSRIEEVRVYDIEDDAVQDAKDAAGYSTVIALNTSVSYDKVLYGLLEGPYEGTKHVLGFEYGGGPLGGDVDFYKTDVTDEFYFPIYTIGAAFQSYHHVLLLKNHFGFIEPHSGMDDVPIFERYYLGGPNTVRGFRPLGLGPHEHHDPLGGAATLWGNLEYELPIVHDLRTRFALSAVAFLDYGNLSPDMSTFTLSEMRLSLGGGLRINFPFLGQPIPIGLYLGYAIKKEDEDRTTLFLFSVGTPF